MKEKISKLHIPFVVIMFVALACIITALCLCDYKFDVPFVQVWQANMPSMILAAAFVALNLVLIISAIVLRIKNDEVTKSEVTLAFQITVVLILEIVLCVPIFIIWIIEKIHDAASKRKNETI